MLIGRIAGATRNMGAPDNWDGELNGHCAVLPIRDEVISGIHYMVSMHEPTPAEVAAIAAGAPIYLYISAAVHPVCGLAVGQPPEDGVDA